MRILHTADWHLDAPMAGYDEKTVESLHRHLRTVPQKIAKLCKSESCDLWIIAGDLFDGAYTKETMVAVRSALESVDVPVIITPGNHDYMGQNSPYVQEQWPSHVHIFTENQISSIDLPALNCTVYGAGYTSMDCPALLKGFHADAAARWQIGVLHGEVGSASSNYCPISRHQLQESGLHYLALGHIHKAGSLRSGDTVCAWPGCPMGKGFDELGAKGVIIADLGEDVKVSFLPLDTPRFYDEEVEAGVDALAGLSSVLPAMESSDFYRVTLTGYSTPVDLAALRESFAHIPNLWLRDETVPEVDIWSSMGEDTLEGVYFSLLRQAADSESEVLARRALLAAKLSRKILDGQEVKLS